MFLVSFTGISVRINLVGFLVFLSFTKLVMITNHDSCCVGGFINLIRVQECQILVKLKSLTLLLRKSLSHRKAKRLNSNKRTLDEASLQKTNLRFRNRQEDGQTNSQED